MSTYAPARLRLADAFKARGISRIVYFHTDHFEPWRSYAGRPAIGARNADDIARFAEAMERIDFARRLTLFYKTSYNFGLRDGHDVIRNAGDRLGFMRRSGEEREVANAAIGYLARETGHEIQLHVHHENFTWNTSLADPEIKAYLSTPEGRAFDDDRFELALKIYLASLEEETGRALPRWFFVHGHWALNASDTKDCNITREIEILQRNGCLGDFTFPAGRPHVNARYHMPFLVDPVDAEKGYDLPQANPEPAFGAGAAAAKKFFIWASKIDHTSASLDYLSPFVRKRGDNIEGAALEHIENSYAENGSLFVKTHSHAMHPGYFEQSRSPVFPHQYPTTQTILSLLFDSASDAGAEVNFLTASEVYDLIASGPYRPENTLLDAHKPPKSQIRKLAAPFTPAKPSTPARVAAGPVAAMDALNAKAVAFLSQRISRMGETASGCYGYYAKRIAGGIFLPDYERTVAHYLATRLPGRQFYVEIGAGLGALPLALGVAGLDAIGIERDKTRIAAGRALLEHLAATIPGIDARVRLTGGAYPATVPLLRTGKSVAVIANLLATIPEADVQAMIVALAGYDALLLDVDRFAVRRSSDAERQQLLKRFLDAGFASAELALDLGDMGHFYLLRPKPAAQKAAAARALRGAIFAGAKRGTNAWLRQFKRLRKAVGKRMGGKR